MCDYKVCCETMNEQLARTCEIHDRYECPDRVIHRWADGRIGIHVKDGGSSMIVMDFCPWCGRDIHVSDEEIDRYQAAQQGSDV